MTMGTFYHIIAKTSSPTRLNEKVKKELLRVNKMMSLFDPESELSHINSHNSTGPITISSEMELLLKRAKSYSKLSGGVYDVTIAPLVKLWGFGPDGPKNYPDMEQVSVIKRAVGSHLFEISSGQLIKLNPQVQIDLGSIAKGYGVDRIAEILLKNGVLNFLVEIGGEVRVSGKSPSGSLWKIGIAKPDKNADAEAIQSVLKKTDISVATSGNYRNYRDSDGKSWAHILNPLTGQPEQTDILSSTVMADTCMEADALATASMLLGSARAASMLDSQNIKYCFYFVKEGQISHVGDCGNL
jgi:thiamine biosynthesis lipoprotein